MPEQDAPGGSAATVPSDADRRKGGDRRQGDRRGDRRTRESFGGVGRKGTAFLDHPWWVVGTVVFGVLVGMLIMMVTSTKTNGPVMRTKLPSGGIDVIVKPDGAEN